MAFDVWGWFGNRSSGEGQEFETAAVAKTWGWFGNRSSGEGLEFDAAATAWTDHAWNRSSDFIMAAQAGSTYTLTVEAGSYSLAGSSINILYGRRILADLGIYSFTGSIINTLVGKRISAEAGTYSYVGQLVDLTYSGALEEIRRPGSMLASQLVRRRMLRKR